MIDWFDPKCMVSRHFSVKECLWLPQWGRLACFDDGLSEEIKTTLIKTSLVMDEVREILSCPMNVHSFYRPAIYSKLIGGTINDVHVKGKAIDFDCAPEMTCDEVKQFLMPQLESFGIRMEDSGKGSLWVHLDTQEVGHARFFKP